MKKNLTNSNKNNENCKSKKLSLYATTGVVAGFINGLFGGGGGMVVVPMLRFLLKYSEREAHATAILIILPLSLLSGLFYASFGAVNLEVLIPAGIGVVVGGLFGALALKKIANKWITAIFSVVMLFAGAKMLFFS